MPRVLCANTTVSVTVTDINDDAPQFPIPVYRIDIFDDTPVGVVLQPVATDQDSGSNAVIRYSLQVRLCSIFASVTLLTSHEPIPTYTQGQTMSLFSINTSNGQISLDRPITLADIATATFMVVATDSGDPPLSGTADVIVRVLNSSEQQLRFRTSYTYDEILENTRGFFVLPIAVGSSTSFSFAPNYTTNPFVLVPGTTVSRTLSSVYQLCSPRIFFHIALSTSYCLPCVQVLELKSDEELMSLGIGGTTGLDREVQDLYTVIVRAHSSSLQQETYTSVSSCL